MAKSGSSLQLNRGADYAIRALIFLAGLPEGNRVMLPELARVTAAPESFLSKILQELCHAGLTSSIRGQSGGFEILEEGRKATISSVISAVDGPVRLNVCLFYGESCDRKDQCPAHPVWLRAQTAILNVLDAQTIEELAQSANAPIE